MKIVIIVLFMLLSSSLLFAQFNTIKPILKPLIEDSIQPIKNTKTMVDTKELDSLSWKMVYEQFCNDKIQNNTPAINGSKSAYYPPLLSLKYNSLFGLRYHPIDKTIKYHSGVDMKAHYEPVYSIMDGMVKTVGYGKREGNFIIVSHGNVESIYCHLSIVICKQGQILKGGTCIAISGNTGSSTGPHLHFGLKFHGFVVNPMIYLGNFLSSISRVVNF